jgi:solute carrier family 25 S-adenosylmethionine transporter 26
MNEHLVNVLAGGSAGMAVDFILYPLDTIKTRLQARPPSPAPATPAAAAPAPAPAPAAVRGFYRGLASAMLGSFPGAATFWTVYSAAKQALAPLLPEATHGLLVPAGAATAAELAVSAVRNPFEVVKQQLQAGLHARSRDAVRAIVRADGLRGLYAGWGSTVARDVPFDCVQFVLYEALTRALAQHRRSRRAAAGGGGGAPPPQASDGRGGGGGGGELALWENSALGMLSGGVAAALTTPLDVVKTRLMTQAGQPQPQPAGGGGGGGGRERRYAGWLDALRRIAAEEGPGALLAGVRPRVLWISLGGAVFFGAFEEFRRLLQRGRRVDEAGGAPVPVARGAAGAAAEQLRRDSE